MIKGDKHLTPSVQYSDTKSNIEALTGVELGSVAYATDNPTAPLGTYNGATWDWLNDLYQPLDAGLTSLSLLGTAANKMIYSTALDAWAEFDTTAFGRGLLNLATGTTGQFLRGDGAFSNTLTGQLFVDGAADQIQLRLQGHSTQTTNLQTWENSAGTVLSSINSSGFAGFGTAPLTTTVLGAYNLFTDTTGFFYGVSGGIYLNPSGVTSNLRGYGLNFYANTQDGNTQSVTQLSGMQLTTTHRGTGTVTTQAGLLIFNQAQLTTGTGATTNSIGVDLYTVKYNAGSTWNITNSYGMRLNAPTVSAGTLNITNQYGIYLNNVSLGTTLNYAIYTNLGLVRLGDALSVTMAADRQAAVFTGYTTQTNAIMQITATKTGAGLQELFRITGLGSGANNDGTSLVWTQKTSTTANTIAAQIDSLWLNATHASRTGQLQFSIYDTTNKITPLILYPTELVINDAGSATIDTRIESDTEANMFFLDANGDTDGALYLGGSTNGIKINKGGELTLIGTATRWNDLRVEPVVRNTGAKAPSFINYKSGLYLYDFDDVAAGSEKEIFFAVQLPHEWKEGSAISPHMHWVPKTAGTAGQVVRWGLEYSKAKIGTAFGASTTIYGTTIVGGGAITTADAHLITEITDITMTGDTISTILICRLFRNSSDAADTYTGTAGLLYIDFHYEIDTIGGSRDEFTK